MLYVIRKPKVYKHDQQETLLIEPQPPFFRKLHVLR
jgi:hypothetical protein